MAGITEGGNARTGAARGVGYPARRRVQPGTTFPIVPLKDVIEMVRLIDSSGGSCRFDDLATALHQVSSSGAFRGRTAAGRMYGAVETVGGELILTDLGRRITSPQSQADALAEAFLNVELYEKLYQRYAVDGGKLPMNQVIDDDIARLGVLPQRASKARQVFMRSAETAGYFRSGRDRLIRPSTPSSTAVGTIASMQAHSSELRDTAEAPPAAAAPTAEHWLVKALMAELPPREKPPTPTQLKHFLETFKMNLETIYGMRIEEGEKPAVQSDLNGATALQQQSF
jgi:hypothetical protein